MSLMTTEHSFLFRPFLCLEYMVCNAYVCMIVSVSRRESASNVILYKKCDEAMCKLGLA